jgi:hypothetical protein
LAAYSENSKQDHPQKSPSGGEGDENIKEAKEEV